jgi:hypothetical protein
VIVRKFWCIVSECDSPGVETTTRAAISRGCNAYAIFKGHEGTSNDIVKLIFKIYFFKIYIFRSDKCSLAKSLKFGWAKDRAIVS